MVKRVMAKPGRVMKNDPGSYTGAGTEKGARVTKRRRTISAPKPEGPGQVYREEEDI